MGEAWHGEIEELSFAGGQLLPAGAEAAPDLRIISVRRPSAQQVDQILDDLGCDPRVAVRANQRHVRARAERVGDTRILTLRPARYVDAREEVDFGDLQLIVGSDYVVFLARCGIFDLEGFLAGLRNKPDQLALGPSAVLHAALDNVVDGYAPVIEGLENDIDEIEDQVFSQEGAPLRRIYKLIREVIGFSRAAEPLSQLLKELLVRRDLPHEEQRYLADAQERAAHAYERAVSFRALLENVLNVNLALQTKALSEASNEQTEQAKKISSWAAILFTPTLVGGIYGMNFRHMPELEWLYGYPFALGLMLVMGITLYVIFKRRSWL